MVKWLRLLLPMQGTWFQSGEKHNLKRSMHPDIHCSTVYSSQDMEATQMSIDRGMDKDVVPMGPSLTSSGLTLYSGT